MPDTSRIAWVTGAGSGIGRGLALRLAAEGWWVAASARSRDDLEALADEAGQGIEVFPLDVTDPTAVKQTVSEIEATLGPIDLAVLNAGTYAPVFARHFDAAAFRKNVDVNLMGTVECLAAVMPLMIERAAGHLAVMASVAGFVGLPSAAAYGATKAALNTMCEALRPDLARYGVTLTVINPGFVQTPLTEKNTFPMPFLISVDEAVEHIVRGLKTSRFEIAFPWQMSLGMKTLALLPHRLLFAITRRMLR